MSQLNTEQKKAVQATEGPVLIIAGAGTGKTKVITTKIAYLINKKLAKPEEIVALTFTEKAASEMEERVDILVPYGYSNIFISTFHSFGDHILRENALEANLDDDFQIMDESSQSIFIRDHLFEFELDYFRPLSNPTRHAKALIKFFSRLKDEVILPEDFIRFVKKEYKNDDEEGKKFTELAKAYETYENLKSESGVIDYGDQVVKTIQLFKKYPKILKDYQKQFKYILVDEFQDTNYAQNELLKMLAQKSNITVVGDDDQSIFRFRGAAVSNILDFKQAYPKAKEVVLTKNYRSSQEILDKSYNLIQHNNPDRLEVKYKIDKKLQSGKGGSSIQHLQFDNFKTEADRVAQIIREKIEKDKIPAKEIAILVRANNQADEFMDALKHQNIPYKFSGGSGLYQRSEIRVLTAFINSITNTKDSLAFYHLVTSDIYKADPDELTYISSVARRKNKSMREILKHPEIKQEKYLSEDTEKRVEKAQEDLQKFSKKIPSHTAGELLYEFVKETGWLKRLLKSETPENEVKIQNIAKFFEKVNDFEKTSFDKSIHKFAEYLQMLLEADDNPKTADYDPDLDVVNIVTIHKSKGLEFEVVFMVNLSQDKFPGRRRGEPIPIPDKLIKESLPEGDYHIQEERRLFYVGMTRAKKELYFTNAHDYGGVRTAKLSQFVPEALDQPQLAKVTHKLDPALKIEKYKKAEHEELPERFFTRDGRLNLSPHQIDDYLSCPLKFKYVNILKVPILAHHSVHYGSAIHEAIAFYFEKRLKKRAVTLEEIWTVFENRWVAEGYITREHEEQRLRAGREALRTFYEKEKAEQRLPKQIEEKFSFNLGTDSGVVRVNGRFDIVYEDEQGVEVSDFKTSEVRIQEDADRRAKQSTQLSVYALAWYEMYNQNPDKVSLQFVESGLRGETSKSEKDFEKLRTKIGEVAGKIKDGKFTATPSYMQCGICAFRDICPYTETKT